ncbi:hypothetical protein Bbelb_025940 [Branchiostoma belcheri]|nr:hypothetical protein Bbelb_025940 [Branchiostoma belcheri]
MTSWPASGRQNVGDALRVTEHWNDPVRNPLLRDFGTCYPVVNCLRALVASAEWNSALAIQCAELSSAQGPECRRHFPHEFRTGRPEVPNRTTGAPAHISRNLAISHVKTFSWAKPEKPMAKQMLEEKIVFWWPVLSDSVLRNTQLSENVVPAPPNEDGSSTRAKN